MNPAALLALALPASLSVAADEFVVLARLDVGEAPHQVVFRAGGERVLIAVSGSDRVVELDVATREETARWEVAATPLGVAWPEGADGPLVTRFGGTSIGAPGDGGPSLEVGEGPSFLIGPLPGERYLTVSERADTLSVVGVEPLAIEASFPTGSRPFPPTATSDGRLAFVPDYDGGTLTPVDLWNSRVYDAVSVGARPSGAAVLPGDVEVAVAVRGENRIAFVNTASRLVVGSLAEGIGESPFGVVVTPNGRVAFVNNTGSADVSVVDLATKSVVARVPVGDLPIAMAVRPDGSELWVACEGSHEVVVVSIPAQWRSALPAPPRSAEPTPVAVLGMIHGGHETSTRWGLEELEATIRRIAPEVVLTEIPPDRWERVWRDWTERRVIEDDRVQRFPEYTDVLLPLATELGFEIVPCAAWTREMADRRQARMAAFQTDPEYADELAAYARDAAAAEAEPAPGIEDDPLVIHSEAYDEWTRRTLVPYDAHMNELLGAGGWTNINAAHMALVDRALDEHAGKRVLVTFGAGHKHWFLDALRDRADVELIDVVPYLPVTAEEGTVEETCEREIAELHAFFEAWFAGDLPDTDEAFARFAAVLDEDFEIVGTNGVRTERASLLAWLRAAHGSSAENRLHIWTRNARSRALDERTVIATYEEWQERDEGPRGRLSTVVFRRDVAAPNGLVWMHVHETWLEGADD